ncbi:MAG: DUF3253 domain-containing protein [Erythrobacter sp.]|nr:DUF3253 domain-containing protein [Erythrobacter sp.]
MSAQSAQIAILALLDRRERGTTICPSEVARALAAQDDWRAHMASVHEAVDILAARGDIALSWKGKPLDQRRGAYRIARR